MPSEMVQETIWMVGNTHPLAKGPWALGGRVNFCPIPDTVPGTVGQESATRGQAN